MPTLALQHATVHYESAGQGQPLLLLHANPGDSRDFAGVLPKLCEQYRVITLDWPGYGRSPAAQEPAASSAMFFAELLQQFVQALELEGALVIGNSVGGYAAVRLALDRPAAVRALVLVSPGGFTPHNFITRGFCRFQGSAFSLPPALLARLYLKQDSAISRAMKARAAGEQSQPVAKAINRAVWRSFAQPEHDLRERAKALTQPTLLVFGRYDPLIPAHKDGREAARSLPGARCEVMVTGHAPFAETPEDFLDLALPFLEQASRH